MIVSVSRRSDVPAFHLEWFRRAVADGAVEVGHPFRPSLRRTVKLGRDDVEAFVFWTRQPRALLPVLAGLDRRGTPSVVLVTLNVYPPEVEPNLPPGAEALEAVAGLAAQIGRDRVAWRYDPIILGGGFDAGYHLRQFRTLAGRLADHAFRAIVSLYDPYRKAEARLLRAGISPWPAVRAREVLPDLLGGMADAAGRCGLDIQACAESGEWAGWGIPPGKCVDEEWLNRRFALNLTYEKDPAQRPECRCQRSVDIGRYRSCAFKCRYCYAW